MAPVAPDAPTALAVAGVTTRYGDRVALRGVSFDAAAGELVALIGPNGAGKTTMLSILAGIQRPDEGTVSTTVGWMQQWSSFGQFAGPPLAAWTAALASGWHVVWWMTGTLALAGLALSFAIQHFLQRQAASAAAMTRTGP